MVELPTDDESMRSALDRAMTQRLAQLYLAAAALMALGLVIGMIFHSSNTVSSAAAFGVVCSLVAF